MHREQRGKYTLSTANGQLRGHVKGEGVGREWLGSGGLTKGFPLSKRVNWNFVPYIGGQPPCLPSKAVLRLLSFHIWQLNVELFRHSEKRNEHVEVYFNIFYAVIHVQNVITQHVNRIKLLLLT